MNEAKRVYQFIGLVLLISLPFYIISFVKTELAPLLIILFTVAPLLSAHLLTARADRKELYRKVFDYRKIGPKWGIIILLLPGFIFLAAYLLTRLSGLPISEPMAPVSALPFILLLFIVMAFFEETGWMGFLYGRMTLSLPKYTAGLILGIIWAAWHTPFFLTLMPDTMSIILQCASIVIVRLLMVWFYDNTNKNLSAMILFHAIYNIYLVIFPELTPAVRLAPVIGISVLIFIMHLVVRAGQTK